ncbi:MAG: DNA double-strand break repair nuclease NurA [Dehalococcoidia bacterium]|nr:MAG: DNA double-strand break repair nuclease NurA [Dehalococcoidia bacterium]
MLDLSRVAGQIGEMVGQLKADGQERQQHLVRALTLMVDRSVDFEKLKRKAAQSKTTFLVAGLVEPLATHTKPAETPTDFSVIATDGSQIDVDRHQSARCYLINIGRIRLDYGKNPRATLESLPRLCADDNALVISGGTREQVVEGALLNIKRSVDECQHLADMSAELPPAQPALAVIDGSLILWGLAGKEFPDFVVEELLDKGFIKCLDDMLKLAKKRPLALASYISFPRSTDVVNALRLVLCPHDPADCDKYCGETNIGKRPCDAVAGVQDRDLFANLLADSERSALFTSQSKIVKENYGKHWVNFFYMKLEDEIARVEIPEWVAQDTAKLGMTHALMLDQCRRGQGYPAALAEAHEQAVVTGADRENFQQLVEILMADEHMTQTTSAKSRSKKTRWV